MTTTRYKIVERDKETQDAILSTLVQQPTQGVAYMFMMTGEPLSVTDITSFLSLSDGWLTGKFNEAVSHLSDRGLIAEALEEETQ